MLAGMLTVSLKSIQYCKNKIVMVALRRMKCNSFIRLLALKIRKMEEMKMSETMENVTEKAEETKVEKFIRLGEYRMNKGEGKKHTLPDCGCAWRLCS